MDVAVKHNGSFITSYVKSYDRVHKICTGIGTLQLVVSDTVPVAFDPWDEIDIYENGDFKVRYYVSSVDWQIPNTEIVIDCQDNSKRLVDYFIPDQYTIETPTFTRDWIETFLDEVGVSYDFNVSSQGNLLSNHTSLGLMSAYEQILILLQLSGWYMYFDGNGVAKIGTLNTDLTDYQENFQREDILDISLQKNDRMLRNRALVWGNFNTISLARVFADVTVHTPWNYDDNDIRTMVVANSNIPNNSSAYNIANLLVKEFAKLTVEKHLTVHGARDLQLGDVVKVNSNVYTGSGLVTTFGVSMSKEGLVTNLILDERCPRLFGYFNFGDYVYVGTYGDGVWRKHLKFVHTWENFSSGLDDLRVTDLHINNGIFSSVTASGGMFHKIFDDVPWTQVPHPDSLDSSQSSHIDPTGSGLILVPFSGIHARATIVDRNLNRILYGVDTWSGENQGDYFLSLSGFMGVTTFSGLAEAQSGVLFSGLVLNDRGWILDFPSGVNNAYNTYPISVSGDYNVRVVDIENDGKDDYVSVKMGRTIIPAVPDIYEWEYGQASRNYDTGAFVSLSQLDALTDIPDQIVINNTDIESWGVVDNLDNHRVSYIFPFGGGYRINSVEFDHTATGPVNVTSRSSALTNYTPTNFFIVTPIRHKEKGVLRFMGIDTSTSKLSAYEAIETSPSALTVSKLREFPTNWTLRDHEDDVYLISRPTPDGKSEVVTLYNIVTDTQSDLVIISTDFTWVGAHSAIGSCLVNGQVHSCGLVVENPSLGVYKYYLISGVGECTLGPVVHEGGLGILTLQDGPTRITGSKSFGVVGANFTDPQFDFDYVTLPGVGTYDEGDAPDLDSSYVANSENLFRLRKDSPTDWGVLEYSELPGAVFPSWVEVDLSPFKPFTHPSRGARDIANNVIYCLAYNTETGKTHLLGLSDDLSIVTEFPMRNGGSSENLQPAWQLYNVGNCVTKTHDIFGGSNDGQIFVYVLDNSNPILSDAKFRVLKRDGTSFRIVQEENLPIRIDISIFSPLLTLQDVEATFNSFEIYGNEVFQTTILPTASGLVEDVQDYRYTYLPGSGELGIVKRALYLKNEDIWTFDTDTMSGVMLAYENIAESGILGRIEASNFVSSGQYIFVTTSGDFPQFYQKDPEVETFIFYSGLPDSRATIIRLDDRI